MGRVIGKVLATEKNPSTMEEFYFWTKPEMILNPFDVVKVDHINNSVTYGVVEEISHITDTANFISDYISSDFGDVDTTPITHRIGMNYVKARIVGNTGNLYIPVLNGRAVRMAGRDEVAEALGLSQIQHPIPCGYLEMYQGAADDERVKLRVDMDARFLIGPEGAHLNISGISGCEIAKIEGLEDVRALSNVIEVSEDLRVGQTIGKEGTTAQELLSVWIKAKDWADYQEVIRKIEQVYKVYDKDGNLLVKKHSGSDD